MIYLYGQMVINPLYNSSLTNNRLLNSVKDKYWRHKEVLFTWDQTNQISPGYDDSSLLLVFDND